MKQRLDIMVAVVAKRREKARCEMEQKAKFLRCDCFSKSKVKKQVKKQVRIWRESGVFASVIRAPAASSGKRQNGGRVACTGTSEPAKSSKNCHGIES